MWLTVILVNNRLVEPKLTCLRKWNAPSLPWNLTWEPKERSRKEFLIPAKASYSIRSRIQHIHSKHKKDAHPTPLSDSSMSTLRRPFSIFSIAQITPVPEEKKLMDHKSMATLQWCKKWFSDLSFLLHSQDLRRIIFMATPKKLSVPSTSAQLFPHPKK